MQNVDEILQEALSPTQEMSDELKARVIARVSERKENPMGKIRVFEKKSRRFSTAAAVAVVAFLLTSVSAFAAWKYLSASDVARKADDKKLEQAFSKEADWNGLETQSLGGYDISLIGLVSGKDITDHITKADGQIVDNCTYSVVAIKKSDGKPMAKVSDDEFDNQNFLVSPYIEGYDPMRYNIYSFEGGGATTIVEKGVQYRIMQVENIEAFADHKVYLGVSDGTMPNRDAFSYDENTGSIARNETYTGVNALLELHLNPEKADAKEAKAIADRIINAE